MKLDEIKNLADLSRIEMTEDEMLSIAGDFDSILSYIGQIQKVKDLESEPVPVLKNITREDEVKVTDSKDLVDEMPETQDGFLKVKKII
ncbi:MAG: Asp-tRNA(Asn)/Glu-tRNA(Gln) amidotransferase subunit GatC [Patescibacteria group bacterium]|nr:Asp-tRNA(Asn)/Glu-tRNA(Gln) amidotransferase subunit GatC [Patescibacteria group bacterium]